MIGRDLEVEILRLHHAEGWPAGTIARQLRVHHDAVRRVLRQAGVSAVTRQAPPMLIDAYRAFVLETLGKYPTLNASRLFQMVRERGYSGGPDHFRAVIRALRPAPPAQAYLRLRTLPGEQGQVDWAHFGKITIGRATRPLMAFVMVLSYSRMLFVRFYLNAAMGNFLDGHVQALRFFEGCPRVLLYDNLKSAVLERSGQAIRFNPMLLELAGHYRFEPRPVAPARGNEKGRVERAIRFVRSSFFSARTYRDLDDLNGQALDWCTGAAAVRLCPEDRSRTVAALFAEERPRLMALPGDPFPTEQRVAVRVGKTPYVRFDLNDYSVPHTCVQRTVTVLAGEHEVRILEGASEIARHQRSFDRGAQIERPEHLQALVEHKRAARQARASDRLVQAAPAVTELFDKAAGHGHSLGVLTRGLLVLLDSHGASALQQAISAALATQRPHLAAVRHFIDQQHSAGGQPPPLAVQLPDNPRVRSLSVRPHALEDYDRIHRTSEDDQGSNAPSRGADRTDDPTSGA